MIFRDDKRPFKAAAEDHTQFVYQSFFRSYRLSKERVLQLAKRCVSSRIKEQKQD